MGDPDGDCLKWSLLPIDARDFSEIVRYLTQEREGPDLGKCFAQDSYEWSRRVLRNEDLKVIWWRLMLEYGRLIIDDREIMSFSVIMTLYQPRLN
ncbi:hypothetical protein N7539_008609 [Penicillium diatomitis]|uniref:Glycosyl transferase CAP10 domain-containing protein n=1 Tax=Penicillium diatomitis TaxID=2819901 RepID=A0A9W9WQK5_9EURO|nr:uncharacterized protein N7539_008808 [Penicillium diatomitis]XP_056786586.1 uncharacterized protein N7539_008609 [Penicillium diatomitis]KAJ5471865.1 hypothetical protein N7539_008808 [Penicillium diatomitis]KAJ5472040.1 hypothetical protein N7539_008609 [Penicillium diatomitis]